MDIESFRNDIHSIITAIFFVIFIGIVWWACAKKSAKGFEEAARIPFDENDETEQSGSE